MFTKNIFLFLLSLSPLFGQGYVTSHIHAQLGNQLFEIAVAVSYALDYGLEARFPEISTSSKYKEILHRVNTSPFPKGVIFTDYQEKIGVYEEIKPDLSKNFRFTGYFQSDKYFNRHKQEIINLFAPSRSIVKKIRKDYGHLLVQPTVALHLRTFIPDGNNPNDPMNWGGFCWDYFLKAMDYFPDSYLFLVFSDSIKWAKKNFPKTSKHIVFIEEDLTTDFYLMSLCDHQIISPRSSFSWWAAYLNQNPSKIVIMRRGSETNTEGVPEGWVRLKM